MQNSDPFQERGRERKQHYITVLSAIAFFGLHLFVILNLHSKSGARIPMARDCKGTRTLAWISAIS